LILMVDFNPFVPIGEQLNSELRAMTTPLVVNRESLNDLGIAEAVQNLSASVFSATPDLLILLLSDDAQASSPRIFRALLGQKRCPPILVVPSSEEPDSINQLFQLGASDYLVPPFRA